MSELICFKTMTRCQTPGMCSPHGGCRPDNESKHLDLGKFIDWIWTLKTERDQLKADNEALRLEREGKVLCDLELFETLRDAANTEADDHRQCMAAYRPLRQENLDSVVKKCDDLLAAMGKGEQS